MSQQDTAEAVDAAMPTSPLTQAGDSHPSYKDTTTQSLSETRATVVEDEARPAIESSTDDSPVALLPMKESIPPEVTENGSIGHDPAPETVSSAISEYERGESNGAVKGTCGDTGAEPHAEAEAPKAVAVPTTNNAVSPATPLKAEMPPSDIKELTIRNLDTGEEYIIGENDPDFEFDTFELDGGAGDTELEATEEPGTSDKEEQGWLEKFYAWLRSKSQKSDKKRPSKLKDTKEGTSENNRTPYTKLSSFKFRRELGKGAFGRVLLAESKIDGQLYALKIISKANMRSSDKRQAKAERDILHAMSHQSPHPFTTGLKFAFQSANNLYIGMEYFSGGNLRQLILKFGHLPEAWVQFYSAELVLAISHLHSLHVIYRDIKPHNIMIDSRGHLILIDYGLSKQEVSHPRGAQSLVGTPDYSAPEVLKTGVYRIENAEREKKGKKKKAPPPDGSSLGYGKAADWWSVGVMIYEMLAGTPPFRGPDLRQTYQNVLFADLKFAPLDRFSDAAMVLLRGLIQRDPSLRLGAWSNPPTDIMESDFFQTVDWDAIMDKRADGPWIPPEEPLLAARRKKEAILKSQEEETNLEGWEENCTDPTATSSPGKADSPPKMAKKTSESSPKPSARAAAPAPSMSEMEPSELLHIRESIFDPSAIPNANKIPDWSFVDEATLRPTVGATTFGKVSSTPGSSKKNLNKL